MIIYLPASQKYVDIPDETKDIVEQERARIVAEVKRKYPLPEQRRMDEAKQRRQEFLSHLPTIKDKKPSSPKSKKS